jgi:hypothetical protein
MEFTGARISRVDCAHLQSLSLSKVSKEGLPLEGLPLPAMDRGACSMLDCSKRRVARMSHSTWHYYEVRGMSWSICPLESRAQLH